MSKSNIEALVNHIERIKKTDIRMSICFSDLYMYLDLEYLQNFKCLSLKNVMELVVRGLTFIHTES